MDKIIIEKITIPRVSVIMPVFNASDFIEEAIDSILKQTFQNFEFIIIDDGSTDDSASKIKKFSSIDYRIKCFQHKTNKGLIESLNFALDCATGEYIIRMDADDISKPIRIEKQVAFMDLHPEIGICGTYYQCFDSNIQIGKKPLLHDEIVLYTFAGSPFAHPTVCMRKSVLKKFEFKYEKNALFVEDYELWTRLLEVTRGANIPEILLMYRVHPNQTTTSDNIVQINNHKLIQLNQLKKIGVYPTDKEFECWNKLLNFLSFNSIEEKKLAFSVIKKLKHVLETMSKINPVLLRSYLVTLTSRLCFFDKSGSDYELFKDTVGLKLFGLKEGYFMNLILFFIRSTLPFSKR